MAPSFLTETFTVLKKSSEIDHEGKIHGSIYLMGRSGPPDRYPCPEELLGEINLGDKYVGKFTKVEDE